MDRTVWMEHQQSSGNEPDPHLVSCELYFWIPTKSDSVFKRFFKDLPLRLDLPNFYTCLSDVTYFSSFHDLKYLQLHGIPSDPEVWAHFQGPVELKTIVPSGIQPPSKYDTDVATFARVRLYLPKLNELGFSIGQAAKWSQEIFQLASVFTASMRERSCSTSIEAISISIRRVSSEIIYLFFNCVNKAAIRSTCFVMYSWMLLY